jgi:SAM-dependent methyltransferase
VETREPGFWSDIYAAGDPPWDMAAPAPPLVTALERLETTPGGRALVPGCGYGNEAILLGEKGWIVTAVDFAPAAAERVKQRAAGLSVSVVERDIFGLHKDLSDHFDLVLEHTCYCAIPPGMRGEYARVMAAALKRKGTLVGLFWEVEGEGPPYSTDPEDIRTHFSPHFKVDRIEKARNSFPERRGEEWLVTLQKSEMVDDGN